MESRGAIWAVAVPLIAFKIWFAILLFSYAPHADTATWIAATHWPLIIIVVILIAGPGLAIYRLMRVRAKRERLRQAEWMVETPTVGPASAVSSRPQWSVWETVSRLEGDGD
jgi:uncharacterized integral membrane protein